VVNPSPIPLLIICACGQKYGCKVVPRDDGRMNGAVACPACKRDGTDEANRQLAQMLPSAIPLKISCACDQRYAFEIIPREGRMPASVACPACKRDGTGEANRQLAELLRLPVPVKIFCACGQKYAFEIVPREGRMPASVACPVCKRDGTAEADELIARFFQLQATPPQSVNALLTTVQSSLAPHLVDALKNAVVQELATQRRELLAAQQAATAELTELARRLEAVQTPLLERLGAYEQRVQELEKELGEQSKENRELLKMKIDLLREQIETERGANRLNFN
jgi:hypothetical protein